MREVMTALTQLNFLTLAEVFFFVFALHELEEWNINRFERRHFLGLPSTATDRSARMFIGFIILVGLLWCLVAIIPGNLVWAAWIMFPAIAIMLQNALQHVYWTFYFRRIAPGMITAVLLVIPLGCYMAARVIEQGYVPAWYTVAWTAFVIVCFIQTVQAGSRITPLIRAINSLGIWLSDSIQ